MSGATSRSHGDALYYADVRAVAPRLGLFAVSIEHARTWSHDVFALFEDLDTFNHVQGDNERPCLG